MATSCVDPVALPAMVCGDNKLFKWMSMCYDGIKGFRYHCKTPFVGPKHRMPNTCSCYPCTMGQHMPCKHNLKSAEEFYAAPLKRVTVRESDRLHVGFPSLWFRSVFFRTFHTMALVWITVSTWNHVNNEVRALLRIPLYGFQSFIYRLVVLGPSYWEGATNEVA